MRLLTEEMRNGSGEPSLLVGGEMSHRVVTNLELSFGGTI
jgi:hypothetical protein